MSISKQKMWDYHNQKWRNPFSVAALWKESWIASCGLLEYKTEGQWWEVLEESELQILVSREYEHALISLAVEKGKPYISYFCLPHPSGIAVNPRKKTIYVASTRNPNQIFEFAPLKDILPCKNISNKNRLLNDQQDKLMPKKVRFYPGSLYIHDLVVVAGSLYANAVAHNAVVKLLDSGDYQYVWWPESVDKKGQPCIEANYLQLNSIGCARTMKDAYFSASTEKIEVRSPGHPKFLVKDKGVIYSSSSGKVICRGLTRPHSCRIHKNILWVNNSGYGEMGYVEKDRFKKIISLPGWTRGLCLRGNLAFVGVSRVIPRFYNYAPGLNSKRSVCGVFAVHIASGEILGSIIWPNGNQIFAVEAVEKNFCRGFLCNWRKPIDQNKINQTFYAFKI